jgi:hypothetical protein
MMRALAMRTLTTLINNKLLPELKTHDRTWALSGREGEIGEVLQGCYNYVKASAWRKRVMKWG